jgi:hypothetical protein
LFSVDQAQAQLKSFGRWRTERLIEIAKEGGPDDIGPVLLIALASVETDLRNIIGGGFFEDGRWVPTGTDRGLFQINDTAFSGWLASVPGCDSGRYSEIWPSALPKGKVPGLTRGARKARDILRDRAAFARSNGVPEDEVKRFMLAAYNAGAGGALKGYEASGNPDQHTTKGNYSERVREREKAFRQAAVRMGWL